MEAPKNFIADPFSYHEELDLSIEALSSLGVGIARRDGWVIMVPFALPGEQVRARVFRNRANYSEADLVEVLDPSPERVAPRCPIFGLCGGCQYQHLSYDGQLEWKRRQVEDHFQRIGSTRVTVATPIGSPQTYGYRSKLTPHYARWVGDTEFPIGFLHVSQRKRIIDVPQCPIATPGVNEALAGLRQKVRATPPKKRKNRGATLLLREGREGVETDPNELLTEKVGPYVFQFRAGEFFQNNPFILPAFVDYVVNAASADGAVRYLIDAYCGVGLFGLSGSSRFETVTGVEVSSAAVTLAETNATINGIRNCKFITGDAEKIFAGVSVPGGEAAVILDPPRRGCDEGFLLQLMAFRPRRVVYVSCDPSTQARDARTLLDGGYRIVSVQPFDLFPQTRHIENITVFEWATDRPIAS